MNRNIRALSALLHPTQRRSAFGSATALLLICAVSAAAQPTVLDAFDDANRWELIVSDGVEARLAPEPTATGTCLRFDYDFTRGAGFCVLHRDLELRLPANYRFDLTLRGAGPANNLEFKLVDPSGENVWWVNRRAFTPPRDWQTLRNRARHFEFAWGPAGGARLAQLGAIELAVAANAGGRGTIWLDRLTFETLPPPQQPSGPPHVEVSSVIPEAHALRWQAGADGSVAWRSAPADERPTLKIDFGVLHEFGGVRLAWDAADYPTHYAVALSADGQRWETAATVRGAAGGARYVRLPDAEARYVRITIEATSRDRGVMLHNVRACDVAFGESLNAMYMAIARDAPVGRYPRYLLGRQPVWTAVGVARGQNEALIDGDGAIELFERGPRLEPLLERDGQLVTWADVQTRQSLADGALPIPTVTWLADGVRLEITAVAAGEGGSERLGVRYRLHSERDTEQRVALWVALRPFQVLPPWQSLNITGGVAPIERIVCDETQAVVDGTRLVRFDTPADTFGATTFAAGDIVEQIERGTLPDAGDVTDPAALASAAWRFDVTLAPGAHEDVTLSVPLTTIDGSVASGSQPVASFAAMLREAREDWTQCLQRVRLKLPPEADDLAATFRTVQAHILINMDGPAIQPGSRTYARSWIRDGALTSTALLYTGHVEPVHDFIEWFAPYQFDSGKIPCVVDRRGPDPVPEHDSTGEFLYLLRTYYEFTGDRALLERHLPRVEAAVDYLAALRAERLTDTYRTGTPIQQACYGLVPESISHEGYAAKPMHSYWDDFWVLRGLDDAVAIAETLERAALAERCRSLRDAFRASLVASVQRALEHHGIAYIPGCVELGDFDATSTAIALYPCAAARYLPDAAVRRTFERYFTFFEQRRDGALSWENYTPYEVRIIGALVRLGAPARAHALVDFFLRDRRPRGWNQWGEVVWREPSTPKFIGDMPHTWVGSDFLSAVRSLFVYERVRDEALVLGAGVRRAWLSAVNGVALHGFPTRYGTLSYRASLEGGALRLRLDATGTVPPGGFVLALPDSAVGSDAIRKADGVVEVTAGGVTVRSLHADVTLDVSGAQGQHVPAE
jgi:hypothetical protein